MLVRCLVVSFIEMVAMLNEDSPSVCTKKLEEYWVYAFPRSILIFLNGTYE